ncbi:GGDEF domain-containing protein [Microaerobacter geothermalis]|uniref:GGDEF domain-containing protein n=1 Tax=Microaerobacter geothermalis TaxID=674972 RepID=UPI001F1D3270|nr:GGDEF domain-containing protein [Microaerobacter geothermalis]
MEKNIHSVSPDKSVRYASEKMTSLRIGSLLVMDQGKLVGIITSRDIRLTHPNRLVADAMTKQVITVPYTATIWEANELMKKFQIERIPVVTEDMCVGIITKGNLQELIGKSTDLLTGVYKSSYIEYIGERLLKEKQLFNLLFIDLDQFGLINKLYGHPFGNDVLRTFVNKLQLFLKNEDYLCRYAGDEFIIITRRNKEDTMELVRQASNFFEFEHIKISASIGVIIGEETKHFFALSMRDIIEKASVLSSEQKNKQNYAG